MNLMGDQ